MPKMNVEGGRAVSFVFDAPDGAIACFVLAHGAGAGMMHPFLVAVASGLRERAIATLRYQFPFAEQGSRRPDTPAVAKATVRAAVAKAAALAGPLPLFAGGKSFGGRMTAAAQAEAALPSVRGLAFIGFPLHPAGRPSAARADHLSLTTVPLLFLQGTRDSLADLALLTPVVDRLGPRATLTTFEAADHSFHVPRRSGRTDAETLTGLLDTLAGWIGRCVEAG